LSDQAADFNFCGPAYTAPMLLQDAQNCINWYVEISGNKASKMPMALLGCPGLNPLVQPTGGTGVVRGAWVLPGGTQCLWVVGSQLVVQTVTVPATQTSIAQFSYSVVGSLLTNSGPVVMRDNGILTNGLGGYVLIVDGIYAYYYRMGGAGTYTFTGGVSNGTPTISLPGTLPGGLLISAVATLSDGGNIPASTYISSINYSTPNITMSANATGTNASETITLTIPAFGQLNDPGLPINPSRLAFIEGWLLINQQASRQFQTNGPVPYTLMFPGSFFALKDSSTDNLSTLYENNREGWLIGEKTSEVWFNAGGANFAFQRIPGVGPQIGCAAQHSITRMGPSLIWLGRNEQGENIVVMTNQYAWERVSNHAIEHAISSYPLVSDAIGFAYEEEGHSFYMLTFPTADVTWCFDFTASQRYGEPVWHQRASFDVNAGVYHRHRANCFVNFQDLRIVGDYQSGQIHQMSRAYFTDAGNALRCQRRSPHVWSREDRRRVFHSRLQLEFTPGVGLSVGQGSDPQVMLRWSDDGGFNWSNEHWTSIGKIGVTKNRATWNRLGQAWDRVYEANFSDPTARDIIGASLFGEAEEDKAA
jgi:hypothetical protein